ncbi:MAG TPA: anthrone oxygenase family protein [Kiloniellales bacterium]|nr:anthrone oxygenase family protein [Kiloniellales bacterium]
MTGGLWFALILVAALGAGLIAGVFFAFSSFVMRALGRLPAPGGIAAMQAINVVVLNLAFLGVFLGTAVLCLVLAVTAMIHWQSGLATWLIGAALCYLLGTVLVTMAFNVPRNDALAKVEPSSTAGAQLWARYLVGWTVWNSVRTLAALAASGLFIVALTRL